MADDLGLDLAAIEAASGGHSIFAPSGSAIWLNTPGCLIPNVLAEDSAGEDAAYGTVGHEVGEQWLKAIQQELEGGEGGFVRGDPELIDFCEPRHRLGEVVIVEERFATFEITIDQEMLDYVRQYVEWVVPLPGQHYVETRVDFSDLTPIPNQGGTADHAVCEPRTLTITDLKMGRGVRVFAERNTQLMIYAYGFFRMWDWAYDFEKIVIRVAQPRLEHFDTWECSREELLVFAEFVREQAHAAWRIGGPRKPGWWCKKAFCKVQGTCTAWLNWLEDSVDDVFVDESGSCMVCEGLGCDACQREKITIDEDGVISGVAYTAEDMEVTSKALVTGKLDLTPRRDPAEMSTEALAKLLPFRSNVERFFELVERELESRAIDGEDVPGFKLVPGRKGRRSWVDANAAQAELVAKGVDMLELLKTELVSPAVAEAVVRKALGLKKKEAEALLDSLVTRPPSRQTLAPVSDERPALENPADDVFEDVSGL